MLYNKNQFKEVNDKKVLRKIRKHWITVSIALLGLVGGGAAATTNASANVTNQSNGNNQANHSLNASYQGPNQRPKLVSNPVSQSHNRQLSGYSQSKLNVARHAERLHNRILFNDVRTNDKVTKLGATNDSTAETGSNASLSQSASVSATESRVAASSAASVVARGGHMISVSPAVRSDMISGASEITSYNQLTGENTEAALGYLNHLETTTSSLASEKSAAENYAKSFYNNKQHENEMTVNLEAARDIRLWGEDPQYFTLYQADPDSIVNNVRSIYEPNASAFATATDSIKDRLGSLYIAQSTNHSTSTATPSAFVNSSSSQSMNPSAGPFASVVSNDASTLNSYNQEDRSYANTILFDLNNLNVSSVPLLSYAKSNVPKYSGRITSFMAKESNEVNSLNDQSSYSNSAAANSVISTANKDISQASLVASDAKSVIEKYIKPLEAQSSEDINSPRSESGTTMNNVSGNALRNRSLSGRIQKSSLVNRHTSLSTSTSDNDHNVSSNKETNGSVESRKSSVDHGSTDAPNDTDATDANSDGSRDISNSGQPSDHSINDPQRMDAKGVRNTASDHRKQRVQDEQGVTHGSAPVINSNSVSAANDSRSDSDQGNSGSKLPQTNEASTKGKELAEISLIMSTTFGALASYIDKHRDND